MSAIEFILFFGSVYVLYFSAYKVDKKCNFCLVDWLNGRCSSPFKSNIKQDELKEKDQKIAELTERVQTLEKIVTEPAYELNKKINALK